LWCAQVPRLGAREGLDAVGREREADAGVTDPRPRETRTHAIAAIPVRRSGAHAGKNPPRALLVGRVDARGQPVRRVVHERDGLLVARDLLDADDGAEALVAHQGHAVIDVYEYGRLEPVALAVHDAASGEKLRALALGIGRLPLEHVELRAPRDR